MLSFIFFLGSVLLLVLPGSSVTTIILGRRSLALRIALGLPMGAFLNVLLALILTIAGIPLTPLSIFLSLMLITIATSYFALRMPKEVIVIPKKHEEKRSLTLTILSSLCFLIITAVFIDSFAHAVMPPTFQYDSATNWTMRSKISFIDQHIAFDPTEDRGMAKPQYPFLCHALQITANQGQSEWSDTIANTILWLLSLSTFIALFLALREKWSSHQSLLTIAGILSIPLFALHLGQGYGDNVLAQYFLLSLVFLHSALEEESPEKHRPLLLLSAVFVAVSVWTKPEGTFFGLIPWILIVALIHGKKKSLRKNAIISTTTALVLSIPWHLFALMKGLLLTPHGSDTSFEFHPEAVSEALHGLFDRGSFGVLWYVIIILCTVIAYEFWKRKNPLINQKHFAGIMWGWIVFTEFLVVYLATPNVRFLLNAESFYRQMMIPLAMLIVSLALCIKKKSPTEL